MVHRQIGFCKNCDSNVVQVRRFESKWAWMGDRMTFGLLAYLGFGPWRCVDCGKRHMRVRRNPHARRDTTESSSAVDRHAPIANYLKSEKSLVNAASNLDRYSHKFRCEVVKRLLSGQATGSSICKELMISELELDSWIAAFQADQSAISPAPDAQSHNTHTIDASMLSEDLSNTDETGNAIVIDSFAVKKSR